MDFRLGCMVDNHHWGGGAVRWRWSMVGRCGGWCCVVRRCPVAAARLLLGILLTGGGPGQTDQVEETSEGGGHRRANCSNHIPKERSCLRMEGIMAEQKKTRPSKQCKSLI